MVGLKQTFEAIKYQKKVSISHFAQVEKLSS